MKLPWAALFSLQVIPGCRRVSHQPGSNQREGVVIILARLVGAKPRAHNKLFSWEHVSINSLLSSRQGTCLKFMKGSFVC